MNLLRTALCLEAASIMTAPFHQPVVCPVLIDRNKELEILLSLIDQAKSGRGQVVLLCGEAGVGKSRLVAEVKSHAASHDFLLLQGSCFPTDHTIPFAPLAGSLAFFLDRSLTSFLCSRGKKGGPGIPTLAL